MRKEWFSLRELAAAGLPELPRSRQGLEKRARAERWENGDRARHRDGRGAGLEYHYSLLPKAAQMALLARRDAPQRAVALRVERQAVALPQVERNAASWAWYDALPTALKERAARRLTAVTRVDELRRRAGNAEAIRQVAAEFQVSTASIHNWLDRVRGVARADWMPALVQNPRGGGGREVEICEEAWEALKADWLRLGEPSFESCFRRLELAAVAKGWILPAPRTLRRRLDAIPEPVRVLARQGAEAAKKLFPAQKRDRSMFHALEAVNADGHKWDVFVRWEDGTIGRPVMLAFQDLYSGRILSWRYGRGESWDMVRLAFGDMCHSYGIPDKIWLDNGRAFASKWLTGGTPNRYRFKVKAEEPLGIFTQLGVEIHWTTPYAGQSKPIERAFGDLARDVARGPWFAGAYTGNTPLAKPEDYGTRAVPIEEFRRIVDQQILLHNARKGRTSQVCAGKLSFNEAFDASYEAHKHLIRQASAEQMRICLLAAEAVKVRQRDGSIILFDNRYWHQALLEHRSDFVTVRFDPDNVQADMPVYRRDGVLICTAELVEAAGFADVQAAREHSKARNAFLRANREMLAAERKMSLAELIALQPKIAEAAPERAPARAPEIMRPAAFRGNLARQTQPEDDDDFDFQLARGRQRMLRAVEDDEF
ncbi:MAG: transposase domain-containing protein [Acidobacteriota bacterium]